MASTPKKSMSQKAGGGAQAPLPLPQKAPPMLLTVEQAHTRLCVDQAPDDLEERLCCADRCMAWREVAGLSCPARFYCGKAGVPVYADAIAPEPKLEA
jgi:hypothetical protein